MFNLTSRQIFVIALIIIVILFISFILFRNQPQVLSQFQQPSQQNVTRFTSVLDSNNEVPVPQIPPNIQPHGNLNATLNVTPIYTLDYQINVENLSGPPTGAHFHYGPPNQPGPIVKTISLQRVDGPNNSWYGQGQWKSTDSEPLTLEHLRALMNGNIYVNVHTQLNPDGEIRGQLRQLL